MKNLPGPREVVLDEEMSPEIPYSNGHEQRWAGGRAWEGHASPGQLREDPGCPPQSSTSNLPVLLRASATQALVLCLLLFQPGRALVFFTWPQHTRCQRACHAGRAASLPGLQAARPGRPLRAVCLARSFDGFN